MQSILFIPSYIIFLLSLLVFLICWKCHCEIAHFDIMRIVCKQRRPILCSVGNVPCSSQNLVSNMRERVPSVWDCAITTKTLLWSYYQSKSRNWEQTHTLLCVHAGNAPTHAFTLSGPQSGMQLSIGPHLDIPSLNKCHTLRIVAILTAPQGENTKRPTLFHLCSTTLGRPQTFMDNPISISSQGQDFCHPVRRCFPVRIRLPACIPMTRSTDTWWDCLI